MRLSSIVSSWRSIVAVVVAFALAWGPTFSFAASSPSFTYRNGGATFNPGTIQRDASAGMVFDLLADGNVRASYPIRPTIVGVGVAAAVTAAHFIPWGRAALWFGPVIAGALSEQVMSDLAAILRCRAQSPVADLAECDAGTLPTGGGSATEQCWNDGNWTGCKNEAEALGFCVGFYPGTAYCIRENNIFRGRTAAGAETGSFSASPSTRTGTSPASCAAGTTLGRDGRCSTGVYTPTPHADIASKIASFPSIQTAAKDAADDLWRERYNDGGDLTDLADPPTVTGPGTVTGPTTTTTTTPQGGAPTTTTSTPTATITYNGPNMSWTTTTTTNNGGSTTTTTTGDPQVTCGLPGTPACKIDETGTPEGDTKNPEADADGKLTRPKEIASGNLGSMPTLPNIAWSFALPSFCGPISIPAFAPFLTAIDVCQFQSTFHDVMGVVWILGGLFGAISVFWRDQLSPG